MSTAEDDPLRFRRRASSAAPRHRAQPAKVTDLAAFRARGTAPARIGGPLREPLPAEVFFDLASPFTYLAVERVHRAFPHATWTPAFARLLPARDVLSDCERAAANARATALRVPLVWPDRWPLDGAAPMRGALFAASRGRAAEFAIAVCRLVWAGGFDLDDPEVLLEAAAAANLSPEALLRRAHDNALDAELEAAAVRVATAGADRLPAVLIGDTMFAGEERVPEAVAFERSRTARGA